VRRRVLAGVLSRRWVLELRGHGSYPEGIAEDKCGPDPATPPSDAGALPESDAGSPCNGPRTSDLPGVRLVFDTPERCSFSVAEVAAGLSFHYQLIVDQDVPGLQQGIGSVCKGPSADNGLITSFEIAGGSERYCFCDTGLCAGPTVFTTTAKKGVYVGKIVWYGDNWQGPSDTFVPYGRPFPPGMYTLTVRASGTRGPVDGGAPFEVSARRFITITP
jgi:hypothetical protein